MPELLSIPMLISMRDLENEKVAVTNEEGDIGMITVRHRTEAGPKPLLAGC